MTALKSFSADFLLWETLEADYSACRPSTSGAGDGAKHKLEGWKQASALDAELGGELPLVLSTLEDASVTKALSLDSNLSEVVEAVAKGDIKPLAEKRDSGAASKAPRNGLPHNSVGRGPVTQESNPPSTVSCQIFENNDCSLVIAKSQGAKP